MPATQQNKDSGAATGQTECLRSATIRTHIVYLHVCTCMCIFMYLFLYLFHKLDFKLIRQKREQYKTVHAICVWGSAVFPVYYSVWPACILWIYGYICLVCMSAYWECTLNLAVGWTWGYEFLALLGYWIWQLSTDLSSTHKQLQI